MKPIRAGLNDIEAGVKQVWHQQHHQKQNGLSEKDSEIAKMVNQTIADSGVVKEAENRGVSMKSYQLGYITLLQSYTQ